MLNRRCGMGAGLLIVMAAGGLVSVPASAAAAGAVVQSDERADLRTSRIGSSSEGRAIELITVSADPDRADDRPALLIVAGIDATHRTGTLVARELGERIAREHGDLLADRTVYIAALVNPDGAARRGTGPVGAYDLSRAPKSIDVDRDRRFDEDGPNDLNGDGFITQMRVKDPAPGSGLVATHVIDEDEPRLMRRADAGKGETPVYAVLIEGVDDDGDGRIGEDPVGGIDLSRHFPYLWDEFDPVTGDYPLEDPGARALADWMLERANIVAVLNYGPHDTLSSLPQDGRHDETRRVPLGIESEDKADYERVREAFLEATGLKNAEDRSNEGSFHGWAYAHLGLYSFSTPLWSQPQIGSAPEKAEAEPAEDEATEEAAPPALSMAEIQSMIQIYESGSEEEQAELMQRFNAFPPETQARIMAIAAGEPDPMAGEADEAEAAPAAGPALKGEAGWLAYADERGEGFVDWEAFDHPDLGAVEIGGFVPGFTLNAHSDDIDSIAEAQAEFAGELLGMFPVIEVSEPTVRALGAGVYRIGLRVSNTGKIATRPAVSGKTRRLPPILIRPGIDQEAVVIGDPIARIERIEAGAYEDILWTVRSGEEQLEIRVTVPESGERTITVNLREGD